MMLTLIEGGKERTFNIEAGVPREMRKAGIDGALSKPGFMKALVIVLYGFFDWLSEKLGDPQPLLDLAGRLDLYLEETANGTR